MIAVPPCGKISRDTSIRNSLIGKTKQFNLKRLIVNDIELLTKTVNENNTHYKYYSYTS